MAVRVIILALIWPAWQYAPAVRYDPPAFVEDLGGGAVKEYHSPRPVGSVPVFFPPAGCVT